MRCSRWRRRHSRRHPRSAGTRPGRPSAFALPPDYAALAERYGAGTFDAGIGVLVPGHPNRFLDLVRQAGVQRAALRYLCDEGLEFPYEPDALLPWAIDDAGNVVWWHMTDPAAPERWPVVANEARGDEWLRFDGGAVALPGRAAVGASAERLHRGRGRRARDVHPPPLRAGAVSTASASAGGLGAVTGSCPVGRGQSAGDRRPPAVGLTSAGCAGALT